MYKGIDISNARIETVVDSLTSEGVYIQFSVYRAADAAAMKTFFRRYVGYAPIAGLGDEAVVNPPNPTAPIAILEVRKGKHDLELSIGRGLNARIRSKQESDALLLAFAKVILARLP